VQNENDENGKLTESLLMMLTPRWARLRIALSSASANCAFFNNVFKFASVTPTSKSYL